MLVLIMFQSRTKPYLVNHKLPGRICETFLSVKSKTGTFQSEWSRGHCKPIVYRRYETL